MMLTTDRIRNLPTATLWNHYEFVVMDRFEAK